MKVNELRIGNLVKINNSMLIETEGEIYKVSGFNARFDIAFSGSTGTVSLDHTKSIRTYSQFDEFIEPIELSEEWLLKFGFSCETIQGNQNEFKVYSKGQFVFNTNHGWWINGKQIKVQPKYVHRLQNLYFETEDVELQQTAP